MARNVTVYPKAEISGTTWRLIVTVEDVNTGEVLRSEHISSSVVPALRPVHTLKAVVSLTIADTDTLQDVVDALTVDDIKPGAQTETVWEAWQALAEPKLAGLLAGSPITDWWSAWSKSDTQKVRQDFRRALVTQRGWTVTAVHQHEGDGTNTDE